LEQALGHFLLYRTVLQERESERVLYLAVPLEALTDVFQEPLGELLIQKGSVRVIGFEPFQEEIVSWTS